MISNELAGEYEKELIKVSVFRLKLEVEALESQIRLNERRIKFIKEFNVFRLKFHNYIIGKTGCSNSQSNTRI